MKDEYILIPIIVFSILCISAFGQTTANEWFSNGTALENLGRYEEAIQAYNKAIEINPQYAEAWNRKGYAIGIYCNGTTNNTANKEALKDFDNATKLKPDYADAWNNKGIALYYLGNYTGAIQAYDNATQIDPKFAEAWHNKGTALQKLGRNEEAIQAYKNASELDPSEKLIAQSVVTCSTTESSSNKINKDPPKKRIIPHHLPPHGPNYEHK
jgi:tetratricopeptide (TPR) repeat protein